MALFGMSPEFKSEEMMIHRTSRSVASLCGVITLTALVFGAHSTFADDIGFVELVARVGAANMPTGSAIRVAQVEAPSGTSYGPDQANAQFVGKTFVAMSGTPGNSGHATWVGQPFYGLTGSVVPGLPLIHLYEANSFIQAGYLRTNQGSAAPPLVAPTLVKVFNHSWIGSFGQAVYDNDAIRRADFAMHRDGTLMCNGENNGLGSATSPLFALSYHGIAVGRMDGQHSAGDTVATIDGPARMKPDLVAPGTLNSYSVPVVSACAALLFDTAMTNPTLVANLDARKPVVIKAALMAGAVRRAGWTNNPATTGAMRGWTAKPLDPLYGADLVNIDRAHMILTGLEQDGQTTVPASDTILSKGWSFLAPTTANTYWRFHVSSLIDEATILATWHRTVPSTFGIPTVANFSLYLHRVVGTTLSPLMGDAGLSAFASGNIVSQSAVDNVELLSIKGLVPGDYVIELKRETATSSTAVAVAWIMPAQTIVGDTNGDNRVDGQDLATLLGAWGTANPAADFDSNGNVDGQDLASLLGNWG